MDYTLDIKSIIVFLVVVFAIVLCWRFIQQKLEDQKYQDELAEEEFERSVLGSLGNEDPLIQPSVVQAPIFSEPEPITTISPQPSSTSDRCEMILSRLKAAGLVSNIETKLEHHGQPNTLWLISLTNGKKALLVPNLESEAFLARHQARADYIIMATQADQAYVCSPLPNFITDNIRF